MPRVVAITLGVFVALGVVGGLVWEAIATAPSYRVTGDGAFIDEQGLARVFDADGWFVVLGLGLGLAAGAATGYAFRRTGWVVVAAVLLGSAMAAVVAYSVGHALGPGDLDTRLRAASNGDRVATPLTVQAGGAYLSWPIGAMLGVLAAGAAWDRQDPAAAAPAQTSWQPSDRPP